MPCEREDTADCAPHLPFQGVERQVRNDLWKGRTPERFHDAMEWLYGGTADNCLMRH